MADGQFELWLSLTAWRTLAQERLCWSRCVDVVVACRDPQASLLMESLDAGHEALSAQSHVPQIMQDTESVSCAVYPRFHMEVRPNETADTDEQTDQTTTLQALRSSIVFTSHLGGYEADRHTAPRSPDVVCSGANITTIHLLSVFPGRLCPAMAAMSATADSSEDDHLTACSEYERNLDLDHLIRQVTQSQHSLITPPYMPCSLDPRGATPCHFAALETLWPILPLFGTDSSPMQTQQSDSGDEEMGDVSSEPSDDRRHGPDDNDGNASSRKRMKAEGH